MTAQGNTIPSKKINKLQHYICNKTPGKVKQTEQLPPGHRKRIVPQTKMIGASNWRGFLPLAQHRSNLSKSKFGDAL